MSTSLTTLTKCSGGNFQANLAYLSGLTAAAVEASRIRPGEQIDGYPANQLGFTVIRPGGRACYPAVWTQDFSMTLASGFVSDGEAFNHLLLVARGQNGPVKRSLASGAQVPPFAIPDHLTFDGCPVYFPGTYSSGDDQGGEPWGLCPPANNHYDFIGIAHHIRDNQKAVDFLREKVDGLTLWERLKLAFLCPETDPETGMVRTIAEWRSVGFIFCDSIYMTGSLLFASLLRRRAALQMADLAEDFQESAGVWQREAQRIERHLTSVFGNSSQIGGWLMAATGVGRQPDVWGTIFALFSKALPATAEAAALQEIVKAVEEGTILYRGAVRHVPINHDARTDSAWEKTPTPHNCYQNGAYWHTPAGWLIAVLWESDRSLALRLFNDMIKAFREEDFRQGPTFGAPWECLGRTPEIAQNPVFLASVTTPYGVLKNLQEETNLTNQDEAPRDRTPADTFHFSR